MIYAPIILFVYNRYDKTKEVILSLLRNIEAKESELFVFSDAPKNDKNAKAVCEVRNYINDIEGFKKVNIILREKNLGLAQNITDGVTRVIKQHGKVIVLEDDIVVGKYFLKYMNHALQKYEYNKNVMEISGYIEPIKSADLPQTMFIKSGHCWGWATWADRWEYFSREKNQIYKEFSLSDRYHFDLEGSDGKSTQLFYNVIGVLDTWAVYWDAAIYINNGLVLVPRSALVRNIGADGSGEHQANDKIYVDQNVDLLIEEYSDNLVENSLLRKRIREWYRKNKPSISRRIYQKIRICILYIKNYKKIL